MQLPLAAPLGYVDNQDRLVPVACLTVCKHAGPPQGTKSLEVQELASHAACSSGAACVQGAPWSEEVPRHSVERETEARDGYKARHKNSRFSLC